MRGDACGEATRVVCLPRPQARYAGVSVPAEEQAAYDAIPYVVPGIVEAELVLAVLTADYAAATAAAATGTAATTGVVAPAALPPPALRSPGSEAGRSPQPLGRSCAAAEQIDGAHRQMVEDWRGGLASLEAGVLRADRGGRARSPLEVASIARALEAIPPATPERAPAAGSDSTPPRAGDGSLPAHRGAAESAVSPAPPPPPRQPWSSWLQRSTPVSPPPAPLRTVHVVSRDDSAAAAGGALSETKGSTGRPRATVPSPLERQPGSSTAASEVASEPAPPRTVRFGSGTTLGAQFVTESAWEPSDFAATPPTPQGAGALQG